MITNYIVEKREAKEGEQWHLVSSSVSGTTCRVPNLVENAGYYFRVSAQNQYGVSEALEIPSVLIIKSPFGKQDCFHCRINHASVHSICSIAQLVVNNYIITMCSCYTFFAWITLKERSTIKVY